MNCPICRSSNLVLFKNVTDYTVSKEIFELVKCSDCDFVFTKNPPSSSEIGKYYQSADYISHTDSNKGIFNKIYQSVRRFSIAQKHRLILSFTNQKKGRLLDYGCGTGAFIQFLIKNGWDVVGMEPDESARKKAFDGTGVGIFSPDLLDQQDLQSFDVITLWHVLEHVHDLSHTLTEFKRILKVDGLLIIAVPNVESWDAGYYHQYWAAYDVPRHLYHFSPKTIHKLLVDAGFKRLGIKPMWFDAFYVAMLSEKYETGKLRILPAMLSGLFSNLHALFKKGTCSSQIYVYSNKG